HHVRYLLLKREQLANLLCLIQSLYQILQNWHFWRCQCMICSRKFGTTEFPECVLMVQGEPIVQIEGYLNFLTRLSPVEQQNAWNEVHLPTLDPSRGQKLPRVLVSARQLLQDFVNIGKWHVINLGALRTT